MATDFVTDLTDGSFARAKKPGFSHNIADAEKITFVDWVERSATQRIDWVELRIGWVEVRSAQPTTTKMLGGANLHPTYN